MERPVTQDPVLPPVDPPPVEPPSLVQLVESLLFVAGEPVTLAQLASATEVPPEQVVQALAELETACVARGIRIQRHATGFQFVSAPGSARVVGRFLGVQASGRLSSAALEVLAIIAYRQPLTRAQIDAIRGVDSSGTVRALLARDLIAEAGRLESIGRPILYATTPTFLQQFGLTSLTDLPPIDLARLERQAAATAGEGLAGEGV